MSMHRCSRKQSLTLEWDWKMLYTSVIPGNVRDGDPRKMQVHTKWIQWTIYIRMGWIVLGSNGFYTLCLLYVSKYCLWSVECCKRLHWCLYSHNVDLTCWYDDGMCLCKYVHVNKFTVILHSLYCKDQEFDRWDTQVLWSSECPVMRAQRWKMITAEEILTKMSWATVLIFRVKA